MRPKECVQYAQRNRCSAVAGASKSSSCTGYYMASQLTENKVVYILIKNHGYSAWKFLVNQGPTVIPWMLILYAGR